MLPTTPLTISCKYLNGTSLVLHLLLTLSSGMRSSLQWVVYITLGMNSLEVKFTGWDTYITVLIMQEKNRNTLIKLFFLEF